MLFHCVCVCVCIHTTSFLSINKWINFYINKMCFYIINSYLFLSVDRHLVCFHTLAIVNNATMNIGVHAYFQISVFVSFGDICLHIYVCINPGMIAGSLSIFKLYKCSNTVCMLLLLSYFIQSYVLETFILTHNLHFFYFCCCLVFVVWICAISFICSYSCIHIFLLWELVLL